jgi:hypothetical protein
MHIERLMLNHGLTPYDAAYAAAHQDLLKPSLRKRGKSLGENTRPRVSSSAPSPKTCGCHGIGTFPLFWTEPAENF